MLIGQTRLKEHFIDLISKDSLPKLIILTGEEGQGKYTLARYIADKVGDIYEPRQLKVDDIRLMVEDAQSLSKRRVYLLRDADEMTAQAQNALLKFAEEPTRNAYIILTVQHENNVLPTIKSRGQIYQLDPYTKEELRQFTEDELILKIFNTPGQIKRAVQIDVRKLENVVSKVIDNISKISAANVFNIINHLDEFDLDLVISMLLYMYENKLRDNVESLKTLEQIKVIYKYKAQFKNKSINKKNALEVMLIELREKAIGR